MNIIIIAFVCWLLWLIFRNKKTEVTKPENNTSPAKISIQISTSYPSRASRETPSVPPDSVWIPQGKSISLYGYTIEGGLLYFGSGLRSAGGWAAEPALINPDLPVDKFVLDKDGKLMRYWPSYSEIAPASRSAYLCWLSEGKKDPDAYIGYVFLYFYGLERRLLSDATSSESAKSETNLILKEIKRLLSIYGKSSSFNSYAWSFVEFIQYRNPNSKLYLEDPPPIMPYHSYEIPLSIQVALAQAAFNKAPLSTAWALATVKNNPMRRLRTPAQRCDEEFGKLFSLRYKEKYDQGLKLNKGKGQLKYSYKPASAGFGNSMAFTLGELPNVTGIEGQMNKLYDIADDCINELDAYSRYLGRKTNERNSLEALSLLPDKLIDEHKSIEITAFKAWLHSNLKKADTCVIEFETLLSYFPSIDSQNIRKQDIVLLSQLLTKFDVGMEPDVRFGGPKPSSDQKIVLFNLPNNAPNAPTPAYSVATAILQLAGAVAAADDKIDEDEERHLEIQLENWLHLSFEEKVRLRAFTRWILSVPASFSGMKSKIALFSEKQCETVGKFMVGVAQADGLIDPIEIKILTKIYKLLGLDAQELYSHAHSATMAPVTIEPGVSHPKVFSLPSAPQEKLSSAVDLDMESIKVKLAETAAVTALLNDIFADDETQPGKPEAAPPAHSAGVAGLDEEYTMFMRALIEKISWTRDELEALADTKGLLLDGALDSINDAAIEAYGSPLFEGDNPMEINSSIAKEILL